MDDVDRDGDPILRGGGMMPQEVLKYSLESGIKMCVIKRDKLNELIAIINSQSKQLKKLRETLERTGADG
jgi:hypothetical protein